MRLPWQRANVAEKRSKALWLDLGNLGDLAKLRGMQAKWQDHGLGLLRTILHRAGVPTDLHSTRAVWSLDDLREPFRGYELLVMNVRSYTFPVAVEAARLFKAVNPTGLVLTGGMHATVSVAEMSSVKEFDRICQGPGEGVIVDLVKDPTSFPRVFQGKGPKSMEDWPTIDRELWPKPENWIVDTFFFPWPLEPACGWGPAPVATILTSRVCPYQCVFCNEASYIPSMKRRPVELVIEELNALDEKYGVGSVVIHDSLFFQNPGWLEQWLDKYPRLARKRWPYWAAARSDTVRRWPELFEALVKETNWNTISIGFESGSDRVLKMLNKECTEEDNDFSIELLNRIGDEQEAKGQEGAKFWANIMLAIPGEEREDAFKTMRMLRRMKRVIPSLSYYAPYPGSVLGHQLIAEGKSLLTLENRDRYPEDHKMKGIDYTFYRKLLAGGFDAEIERGMKPLPSPAPKVTNKPHFMYVFSLANGKKKLAYGESPAAALETLKTRLTPEEIAEITADPPKKIHQRELLAWVPELG